MSKRGRERDDDDDVMCNIMSRVLCGKPVSHQMFIDRFMSC